MRHLTVQQISGSLDGALSGVSLELVVRHLSSCRECRERHARLTKQDDALRRLLACEFPELHHEDVLARLGVVLESESRGEMTPEHALPPELPPLAPEPSRSREMPRPPSQQLPNPALLSEEEQRRRAAEALKEAEAAAMASLENLFRDLNAQKLAEAAPPPPAEPTPATQAATPRSLIELPPDVLSSLRAAAPTPEPEPVAEEPAALQWTVVEGPLPTGPDLTGEIEPHLPGDDETAREAAPIAASDPVATNEPESVVASEPEPVVANEPGPVVASEPEPVVANEPEPVVASEPEPVVANEPGPVAAAAEPAPERPRLRLLERARLDSPAPPHEPEPPAPRVPEPLALVPEREPRAETRPPHTARPGVPRGVVLAIAAGVAMLAGVIALSYMPPVIRVPVPELPRPRVPRIEVVKVPVGTAPRTATQAPPSPARRAEPVASRTSSPAPRPTPAPVTPAVKAAPATDAGARTTPQRPARGEAPPPAVTAPRDETPARPAPAAAVTPARPAPAPVPPPAPVAVSSDDAPADDGAEWPLLCGVVVDDAGSPVAGARIALADLDLGARTDRRGHFCLAAPPGDRTLSVVAAGFATHRRIVSLGSQTLELSIALTPAP